MKVPYTRREASHQKVGAKEFSDSALDALRGYAKILACLVVLGLYTNHFHAQC